ncbi:MAG: hypothetical protein K9L68_02980 [Spirochaetales bacterium]|nr:hypothetical protein [Spirochaetales bacterium]MCF7937541.1 hypothetical protein [Spirochaetales bacterium]
MEPLLIVSSIPSLTKHSMKTASTAISSLYGSPVGKIGLLVPLVVMRHLLPWLIRTRDAWVTRFFSSLRVQKSHRSQ